MRGVTILFVASCLAAALAPLRPDAPPREAASSFPGWPTSWDGQALVPEPLSQDTVRWARRFPGRIGRFRMAGGDVLLLRWVTGPTRTLHPARDCYRGAGYDVHPGPALRDEKGRTWSSFRATRHGQDTRDVREMVVSVDGGSSWPDVESWYWNASRRSTPTTFWAVTRVRG